MAKVSLNDLFIDKKSLEKFSRFSKLCFLAPMCAVRCAFCGWENVIKAAGGAPPKRTRINT